MSREDVERALSVYGVPSPEPFFALFADDVVIDNTAYPLPDHPRTIRGRDAAIAFYREYWDTFADGTYTFEAEDVVDARGRIVIVNRERGTGRSSGAPIDRTISSVWTFENGELIRLQLYRTHAEALSAVGVRG